MQIKRRDRPRDSARPGLPAAGHGGRSSWSPHRCARAVAEECGYPYRVAAGGWQNSGGNAARGITATVLPPPSSKRASMSGRSRGSWAIGPSTRPRGPAGSPHSLWRHAAAPSTSCPAGTHPSPRRSTPMRPPTTTAGPGEPAGRTPGAPSGAGADIFRLYGAASRRHHPVPPVQQPVLHDSEACRTAQRGGHAAPWPRGGFERYAAPACRNRPGPTCPTFAKGQGVEDRPAA